VTEETTSEIELHNRRGEAVDRFGPQHRQADHGGRYSCPDDAGVPTLDFSALSPSELERLLELTETAKNRP